MKTPKVHKVIPVGSQVKIKCNIERQVFEKSIPISFEPDLRENEPALIILSSRQDIQNYVKIPIINRTNHDTTLPPNTIIGSTNQVQSVTTTEPANINLEEEKETL